MARIHALLAAALVLAGCGSIQERIGAPGATWLASPNFDDRRPQFVIIHHTSNDTAGQALAVLTNPAREVSAHYLVGRDGRVFQLVDERKRAWHAGTSRWGGDEDLNSSSIGIELDNDGNSPFTHASAVARCTGRPVSRRRTVRQIRPTQYSSNATCRAERSPIAFAFGATCSPCRAQMAERWSMSLE